MLSLHETSIRMLKIYITVVEAGGFSAAQAILNTSASTISVQIKELEAHLGVTLCSRGRSGFVMTEEGDAVYEAAQRVLAAFGTFNLEVAAVRNALAGEVRIGLQPNMATNADLRLNDAMRDFHRRENEVHFRIEETRSAVLEARTLEGKYDVSIGIFSSRLPGLEYRHIFTERVQLYCSSEHALGSLAPEDIRNQIGRFALVSAGPTDFGEPFRSHGLASATAVTESMDATLQLVSSGAYIGVMPTHFAEIWVKKGEVIPILPEEVFIEVEFFMITKKRDLPNKVVGVFLESLMKAHNIG